MTSIVIVDSNSRRARELKDVLSQLSKAVTVVKIVDEWETDQDLLSKLSIDTPNTWLLAHARNIENIKTKVESLCRNRIVRYSVDGDNSSVLKLATGMEYSENDWKSFFGYAGTGVNQPPLWILIRAEFWELIEHFSPLSFLDKEENKQDRATLTNVTNMWLENKKQTKEWESWKERVSVFIEMALKNQAIDADQRAKNWLNAISDWVKDETSLNGNMDTPIGVVRGYL